MAEAIDEMDKLCKFHKNLTKNVDLIVQTRLASFQLKMAIFSNTDCPIFLKINRVEGNDKMDKLCRFHKNPTKIVDLIA